MKTSEGKLREFLNKLNPDGSISDDKVYPNGLSMQQYITVNPSWDHKDIVHYLRTEQDPIRLARWCELYLQQDY